MADKVTSLYNALKADGLFKQARSLNDFKAKMAYQGYRSQIYKLARDKGANVGTFSQFTNALGYSSGSPKPRQSYGGYQPQQQKPVENTAMTAAQKAMQVAQEYQQAQQPVDYLHRPQNQMGRPQRNAPANASPFVQSLYEVDNAQNGPDYAVDYTSPKATQQVYQQNQQVRKKAAKTASDHIANDEYRRQSQPMIDNGTVGVMKPMGEIEQEMSDSASKFVDANLGDYINSAVLGEQNAANQRGLDAANRVPLQAGAGGGMGLMVKGMAYNKEVDPDTMAKNLTDNARNGFLKMFQDPNFVAKLNNEAARLGVTPEAYIESIMPHLKDRLAATLQQSEYLKALPKNMLDNVANRFIDSNLTGQLLRLATQTRGQRVIQERASAATAAGENPYYKGSTAENVTADIGGFVADPLFGASAKLGGLVAGKLIGNSAKLAALMANGNLAQRLMARGAQAVTSGGVTGFVFDSTGSVIQNYSTGEDTSLGNTLKVAAKGGTSGAVNFATMSLAGIPLSEVGRSVGLKAVKGGSFWGNAGRATAKVGLESGKTYMEAMGMYLGGYVSGKLEGRTDANGKPIEFDLWNGTMESLPTAIGFRLQHAVEGLRGGRKNEKGEDMGWFGSTLANFKDFVTSDKAKESRFLMTEDERNMIFSSGAMNGLMPDGENIVSYAKRTKNKKVSYDDPYLETDASMIKNTYDQIMADPKVSWDAKAKFSAMVTGIMPSARPMMDYITYSSEDYVKDGLLRGKRKYVNEYSVNGELLSKIPYDNKEDRDNVVYNHNIKRENLRLYNAMGLLARQDRNNYELQNDFFVENMKKPGADVNTLVTNMGNEGSDVFRDFSLFALNSEKGTVLNTIDSVAVRNGMKSEDLIKAMEKNPMKRTDFEQNVCVELRRALEAKAFPDGKAHAEQSNLNGKDVAEDNNLGTEQPNGDAVKQELNGLRQAEAEVDALLRDNDVFSQNFKKLQNQGLTNPQIYDWMVQQGGLTVEQLEPFAHYINANARVQGMQEATKQKIEETVSAFVQDWSYHGTFNGQPMNGEQALYVQDSNGRTLLVGSGDVAFDQTTGRAKEGSGDMLVCFDPNTREMVYVKADEVTLFQNQPIDQFAAEYRQRLQMKNSEPYNQAAQEQAMQDAAKPQPKEQEAPQDSTTKEGDLTKDNTTLTKVNTTSGKDNTTNEDLVPQEQPQQTRKFADGSDVPMATDSKGRPTPDYEKMTPEQSAEILTEDFGDNAEKVVDGQIKKAENALKDAEKMKVDYTAEPNDIMEQETLKNQTIEAAKKQLDHAQNIKKAMTAKNVAETVGKTEQTEGAHEAGSVTAQKFVNAPRLVGNKRTRMLPDGETKIKGHYEIVPAESLTPSHDVNNGYKKSEGFPTDAEGRTVNDRDYEHDKAAQQNTDQIARKYNGMAIEQVPVVSDEGIVYDGNGRAMAGQKAAKEGTDGEYINDLLENAENFGFTREQIEQSGIEHPRLVLVTDERLPYDTATFAKFNRNEKKTQSNTEQAVAKAKTLTSDEVGAIVAEIEGNGSLDAFFNNSKAINDLVKTLVDKGIIGQNEVAQMMDSPERLSAQGREYVKNLLLGSIFKPETIRMLGIDSTVKNKAINAIRSVMDNMKLGEFSLRDEIDQAIQLLYEARRGGNKVDTLLRTSDMFGEDAAKRYPSISQMMALALEGKVSDFRDLLDEYNRIAAARNTGEGDVFGEAPTKPELIKEFLDFKKWQDYGTGHSENEGSHDVSGVEEPQQEASGGNEPAGEERPRVEEADDLENKELESRIEVTDEETETPSKYGPIMKQKIVIDGDKEVMKVDEPNKKGEYTGSYYEYDGKKFGDLNEVTEYIDSKNEEGPLPLLPKEEKPDPQFNPIEAAAAEFKKEHPLTEEEIMKSDVDDLSKDMALDYLNGEVTDDLHRAIYESIYAKRKGLKAEPKVETPKAEPSADPMEAFKNAAEGFEKEKKGKAINDIMDDFNETIDDISMNEIEQDGFAYKVTDKDELDRLNKEKTFRMYSGMQEVDGKLYSPMAAIIDGKRTDATEIGAWMGADERPDLVKNGKFTLVKTDKNKGVGEGDVPAAYNPYMHTSTSMMNDQFTGAYARGNIKVVEWEIPESEKTSGYHAEGAKDAVGLVPWHSGSVNSLLPKDRQRQVMLSRWRKAVRVVPDSEVAESIAEQLKGTGLAIPWNVVTPNQVRELAKLGVPITTVESGRQAPETKEKFLQQMAELEQEFPQAKFVNVKMTKDAFKEWGKDGGTKFRTDHGDGNYPTSSVENHVEKVAQKTGAKVNMVSSVDEVTNKAAKAAIEEDRKITGWYDEKTGEVHLYMPNIHDRYTAEKTIWHEVVGHKGMRELFGEDRFNQFLRDVWYDLDKPENAELKKLVDEERRYNPLNIYDAIEEGIARLAEDGKGEPGFWNGIKNKVSDFLHEIGYRVAPNTKDIKYLLWLAKNYSKHPESDGYFAIRRNALLYKLERDNTPSIVEKNGMFFDNDGKNHDYLLDLNHKDFEEATDGKVHFRTSPMAASKIEEYDKVLGTKLYAFKESTLNHLQALEEAMKLESGEKDVWKDIPSAFNPLQAANRMDSVCQRISAKYDSDITEPLAASFKRMVSVMDGKNKDEQKRNAELYMITKHGLERNRVLYVRDTIRDLQKVETTKTDADRLQRDWNATFKDLGDKLDDGTVRFDQFIEKMDEWIRHNIDANYDSEAHDYSGLTAIKKERGKNDPDYSCIDDVMSTESKIGKELVEEFWKNKAAATDFIIDQEYHNGFKDSAERNHLKSMFKFYIPLRKFDETTAEDIYGYITEKGNPNNYIGSVIANAKGRESLSDVNVLAQISAMAKTSILNGGKNVVKQHLLRFVQTYESGNNENRIFLEINPWVEKHTIDGNEVWEEVTPQIPENATQEQISNIVQSFESSMQAKKENGEAKLYNRRGRLGVRFQKASDKDQHIVEVYVAGKKRLLFCQGNPRAAQAVNGLIKDSGASKIWAAKNSARINRFCARANTSYNVDFMFSNLTRDLTTASANVTKEGPKYTRDFCKEYLDNLFSFRKGKEGNYWSMFSRYKKNKLDMNNDRERMFKEFMDNGGQTGFTEIKKLEDMMKEYDNLIKKGNMEGDPKAWAAIKNGANFIEVANELFENIARYSCYVTSRKSGRSIGRSIYDAKEVSGNFNKHGSGDAIKRLKTAKDSKSDVVFRNALGWFNSYMKNYTMFYNAGVQGASLFARNFKRNAVGTSMVFGVIPFALGIAQALINQYRISNEDEKERGGIEDPYAELPEWKRRNNICIYWGKGKFKTIPIGIELRAFFGLGDIVMGQSIYPGLKSDTPVGCDILGQMAQLVPASDFLGHHSPSGGTVESLTDLGLAAAPTVLKPELELIANRDWTGRPIYRGGDYLDYAPRWKRAYDSTSGVFMDINKWANMTFNDFPNPTEDMKGNDAADFITAPYIYQHLLEGYFGGLGSTTSRIAKAGYKAVTGNFDEIDPNQIPLYRVFNYKSSEGYDMQRTKSKWYNYSEELKQTEYNIRQLKTNTPDAVKNIENSAKKYNFTHGKEGKAYNIWEAADSYISKKKRQLNKASNPEVIKSINEDINRKMQEAVNDLDKLN